MAEIDIDNLTLGQIKALRQVESGSVGISDYVGKKVIVRTLSAGVFYGVLLKKAGDEVILGSSRRLWQWFAKEGISLSAVAVHGVNASKSRITGPVESQWLQAIEIIPCSASGVCSIEGCDHAKAG